MSAADRLYSDAEEGGRWQSPCQLSPSSSPAGMSSSPRANTLAQSHDVEQQERLLPDDERPTFATRPNLYAMLGYILALLH